MPADTGTFSLSDILRRLSPQEKAEALQAVSMDQGISQGTLDASDYASELRPIWRQQVPWASAAPVQEPPRAEHTPLTWEPLVFDEFKQQSVEPTRREELLDFMDGWDRKNAPVAEQVSANPPHVSMGSSLAEQAEAAAARAAISRMPPEEAAGNTALLDLIRAQDIGQPVSPAPVAEQPAAPEVERATPAKQADTVNLRDISRRLSPQEKAEALQAVSMDQGISQGTLDASDYAPALRQIWRQPVPWAAAAPVQEPPRAEHTPPAPVVEPQSPAPVAEQPIEEEEVRSLFHDIGDRMRDARLFSNTSQVELPRRTQPVQEQPVAEPVDASGGLQFNATEHLKPPAPQAEKATGNGHIKDLPLAPDADAQELIANLPGADATYTQSDQAPQAEHPPTAEPAAASAPPAAEPPAAEPRATWAERTQAARQQVAKRYSNMSSQDITRKALMALSVLAGWHFGRRTSDSAFGGLMGALAGGGLGYALPNMLWGEPKPQEDPKPPTRAGSVANTISQATDIPLGVAGWSFKNHPFKSTAAAGFGGGALWRAIDGSLFNDLKPSILPQAVPDIAARNAAAVTAATNAGLAPPAALPPAVGGFKGGIRDITALATGDMGGFKRAFNVSGRGKKAVIAGSLLTLLGVIAARHARTDTDNQ